MNKLDMYQDLPDSHYRIIFHLRNVGWVRGWFGDSWFEAHRNARGLSSYDVRILDNRTGDIVYEKGAQTALRPVGSDS